MVAANKVFGSGHFAAAANAAPSRLAIAAGSPAVKECDDNDVVNIVSLSEADYENDLLGRPYPEPQMIISDADGSKHQNPEYQRLRKKPKLYTSEGGIDFLYEETENGITKCIVRMRHIVLRGRDPICKKLRQGGVTPPASPAGGSVVTVAETAPVVSDDSVVSDVQAVRPCRVGNLLQYQGDLYGVTEIMSESGLARITEVYGDNQQHTINFAEATTLSHVYGTGGYESDFY